MSYLYEGHLGSLYMTDEQLDMEELYCEECGDYDWELGEYETLQGLWDILLLGSKVSIFDSGGFALYYIATLFCNKPQEELKKLDDLELLRLIKEAIDTEQV